MSNKMLDGAVRRPLPTLAQWLDERGGGARAEVYSEFQALCDLAERTILQSDGGLTTEQACFLRLWQGFSVATVEFCNIENRKDIPTHTLVAMLPRAMACAAIYAFASVAKEDAPLRQIAKLLAEEFRAGAKFAADDLMDKAP